MLNGRERKVVSIVALSRITFVCLMALVTVPVQAGQTGKAAMACRDCPELVPLAAGTAHLGEGGRASAPVAAFALGRTEVSHQQWQACVTAGACRDIAVRWTEPDMPMTDVTVRDTQDYLAWLTARVGRKCRLPTEAEWEYAARAGTDTAYPWGDDMAPGRAVCHQCDPRFDHRPAPVATMAANPWGLFDMNGNVWEWTADCWDGDCRRRVIKGGSWYFVAAQSRSWSRSSRDGRDPSYDVGFRVACEP